jgi:hypothetical protein
MTTVDSVAGGGILTVMAVVTGIVLSLLGFLSS